jgi:hypothetical protein
MEEPCTKRQKKEYQAQIVELLSKKKQFHQELQNLDVKLTDVRNHLMEMEEHEQVKLSLKKHPLHLFLNDWFSFPLMVLITDYLDWTHCSTCFVPIPQNGFCLCVQNSKTYPICDVQVAFHKPMNFNDVVFADEKMQEIWNTIPYQEPPPISLAVRTGFGASLELFTKRREVTLFLTY